MKKYRRKQYIIDSKYQWKFAFEFTLLFLIGNGVSTFILIFFWIQKFKLFRWGMDVNVQSTIEVMYKSLIYLNITNLVLIVVLFLIAGLLIIRRMRNLLVKITGDMEKIVGGDLFQKITLGPKDEFQNVAEALNEMLHKKRERFRRFRDDCHSLSKGIVDLNIAYSQGKGIAACRAKLILEVKELKSKGAFSS